MQARQSQWGFTLLMIIRNLEREMIVCVFGQQFAQTNSSTSFRSLI
jgi:hypothetical protein